jgi:hypothetical protein
MTQDKLENQGDLLLAYTKAKISAINERSGSISEDCKALRKAVEDYARQHWVAIPNIDWDLYIHD